MPPAFYFQSIKAHARRHCDAVLRLQRGYRGFALLHFCFLDVRRLFQTWRSFASRSARQALSSSTTTTSAMDSSSSTKAWDVLLFLDMVYTTTYGYMGGSEASHYRALWYIASHNWHTCSLAPTTTNAADSVSRGKARDGLLFCIIILFAISLWWRPVTISLENYKRWTPFATIISGSGMYCAYTSSSRGFALSSFLHYLLWTSARSVYSGCDITY